MTGNDAVAGCILPPEDTLPPRYLPPALEVVITLSVDAGPCSDKVSRYLLPLLGSQPHLPYQKAVLREEDGTTVAMGRKRNIIFYRDVWKMFSGSGILLSPLAVPCSERQVDCGNDPREGVTFAESFSRVARSLLRDCSVGTCKRGPPGTFWVC